MSVSPAHIVMKKEGIRLNEEELEGKPPVGDCAQGMQGLQKNKKCPLGFKSIAGMVSAAHRVGVTRSCIRSY